MTKVMIVGITLPVSGDVPLLVEKAFRQLGCATFFFALDEDLPLIEALFYSSVTRFWRRPFNRRLFRQVVDYQPDILLIYGSNYGVFPSTLRKIKRRVGCQIVLWEENLYFWRWYQSQSFPYYDHLFSGDSYPIPLLTKPATGLKSVHFLGGCCDPDEHSRVPLSLEEEERFGAQVTFIGGGRPRRRRLFEHLTGYRLKLWGWGWDQSPALEQFTIKEPVFGLKKTKIYSASQICPNLQSGLYQVNGLSVRPFEVACSGRLPFSEPQADLSLFFEVGEEVATFEGPDDLKRKVHYYLSHPDEMDRMGERARQRVIAEHTYRHRVKELLEIVLNPASGECLRV